MASVLIAIKPRYAKLILSRKKRVEVRRRGSSIKAGDRLVIYSSSPERSVVGTCKVDGVLVEKPGALFRQLGSGTCLTKSEFNAYLMGTPKGVGIEVSSVRRLSKPISLHSLREKVRGFGIPQSYRFLSDSELKALAPAGL